MYRSSGELVIKRDQLIYRSLYSFKQNLFFFPLLRKFLKQQWTLGISWSKLLQIITQKETDSASIDDHEEFLLIQCYAWSSKNVYKAIKQHDQHLFEVWFLWD